jgi:hypothetical protein
MGVLWNVCLILAPQTTLSAHKVASVNDPKYKKYALAVEKCLTTFDNVHEWADFISFLTKLLKVRVTASGFLLDMVLI